MHIQSLQELCFSPAETIIRQKASWDSLQASIWKLFGAIWEGKLTPERFPRSVESFAVTIWAMLMTDSSELLSV